MGHETTAGATLSRAALESDPHPVLASLRQTQPVAWVPLFEAWVVTSREACIEVLTDATTFTVDDDRFSTRQVVGPSMLSLDGPQHRRHRTPFSPAFRAPSARKKLAGWIEQQSIDLVEGSRAEGGGDLRALIAAPLAARVMRRALGLGDIALDRIRDWNDRIIAAIDEVTLGRPVPDDGGQAFAELRQAVARSLTSESDLASVQTLGDLTLDEIAANVAVLLIGGVVTSEGAIAICLTHLLAHPETLERVRNRPDLVEKAVAESLRLEPAAAFVDRYATRDVTLGGASIAEGDLVRVSISAANRDPGTFDDPDTFDIDRPNSDDHLAFARGPHACLGIHVARLETRVVVEQVVRRLPDLEVRDPVPPRGLIFRAPPKVPARWKTGNTQAIS